MLRCDGAHHRRRERCDDQPHAQTEQHDGREVGRPVVASDARHGEQPALCLEAQALRPMPGAGSPRRRSGQSAERRWACASVIYPAGSRSPCASRHNKPWVCVTWTRENRGEDLSRRPGDARPPAAHRRISADPPRGRCTRSRASVPGRRRGCDTGLSVVARPRYPARPDCSDGRFVRWGPRCRHARRPTR